MDLQGGNRFFFDFEGDEGFLSEEESHHLLKVLRKKKRDKIKLINGKGFEFEGEITDIFKKGKVWQAKVKICSVLRTEKPHLKKILAFIPILKGDKTEFLVEKGTELGIGKFIPFYSDFSVVKPSEKLQERLRKKAINALKQSGRLFLPEISPVVNLTEFLLKNDFNDSLKFFGSSGKKTSLKDLMQKLEKAQEIILISGPEGGFSKKEEELLLKKTFYPITISPYILKAETASLSLMSIFSFLVFGI
ncbi:RsmE family RNA methyltransferase [Thermodesulfobacterium hydrogeniphilum]|uniref:RsmE family RNA methyltransferase n=1 Tax=Thermodesulfobacterium hydrogeniphilum TaxID=161156 RepID=UPI000A05307A|nr:RsmE family RNA methyltransferase [Thermodesulfobacterium hydrogeniphilum]